MAKGVKTGGGSRKGSPNRITKELKEMILGALDDAGGQEYLLEQAKENPTAFMTLVGKTLPKQVDANMNINGTINFSSLSDSELQSEIAKLNEQLHGIK